MCGRFALTATPEEIEALFALMELDDFPPRYNIAPTQPILIVTAGNRPEPGSNLPDRKALLVRWGLIPGWAKDPKDLPLLFNARSETAAEKASFRAALRHRRSLIPASGFYEWRRDGKNGSQAFWIRPKGGGIVAFGGLMETFSEPGGSEIDTAAILTTAASGDIADIHDRMPVVISPEHFSRWLDCRTSEPRDVARPDADARTRAVRGDSGVGQGQQGREYRTGTAGADRAGGDAKARALREAETV